MASTFALSPSDGSAIAMNGDSIVRLGPTGTRTIVDFTTHPVGGVSHFQPNGIAVSSTGTIFVDTGTIFDGPGGTYTTYLTNAGGQPVRVRENDGIHLTLAGANRLSPAILAPIVQRWRSVAPP